jgi:hypothetical protein
MRYKEHHMNTSRRFSCVRVLLALLVPAYLVVVAAVPGISSARPATVTCPPGAPGVSKGASMADVTKFVSTNAFPHNINAAATISSSSVAVTSTTLGTLVSDEVLVITDTACPSSTRVWYAAFTATGGKSFVFLGPPGKTASYPAGFEVFRVDTGNLIIAGGTLGKLAP